MSCCGEDGIRALFSKYFRHIDSRRQCYLTLLVVVSVNVLFFSKGFPGFLVVVALNIVYSFHNNIKIACVCSLLLKNEQQIIFNNNKKKN